MSKLPDRNRRNKTKGQEEHWKGTVETVGIRKSPKQGEATYRRDLKGDEVKGAKWEGIGKDMAVEN